MKKHKILIVDDNPVLTMLFKLMLESTGRFTVQTENLAAQALPCARQFLPELVFLDCYMPDGDGRQIASDMLRDPVLNAVPIVMITGTVTDEDAAASYRFGNLPLLTKPFLGHDLAEYALGILEPQHAAAA